MNKGIFDLIEKLGHKYIQVKCPHCEAEMNIVWHPVNLGIQKAIKCYNCSKKYVVKIK